MTTRHDFDDFPHAGREWSGWIEYTCTAPSHQTEAATRETPPEFSEAEFELVNWGDVAWWMEQQNENDGYVTAAPGRARAVAVAVFEDLEGKNKLEEGA